MQLPTILLLVLAALAQAEQLDPILPLRFLRRALPISNISTAGDTTATPTTSQPSGGFSYPTSSQLNLIEKEPPTTALSTTPSFPVPTAPTSLCQGIATYTGSVPPTVYVTITEGFEVTVTASNMSLFAAETIITPPPPCQHTIMPLLGTMSIAESTAAKSESEPASTTGRRGPGRPDFSNPDADPDNPLAPQDPGESEAVSATLGVSSVDYTSTVIVTKKTPVTVVVPPITSPGVIFQIPTPTPTNNNPPLDPGSGPSNNDAPLDPLPGDQGPANRVPSTTPAPTSPGAVPLTTIVNNVPIAVQPSSIVVGSTTIPIPSSNPTTITVDGTPFIVGPSRIIGPSGTVTISQQQAVTPGGMVPSTTVTANDRLTFVVGETVAVIDGTTFRIGNGAPATTITVDSVRISIGPDGVGLPQTTVAPGPFLPVGVHTVHGITFSVGETDAAVSGTTYRIGDGASETTTVIGSETVSFGPGGVGLRSTTLVPSSTQSGSSPSRSANSASASATSASAAQRFGAPSLRLPFTEMLSWCLILALGVHLHF